MQKEAMDSGHACTAIVVMHYGIDPHFHTKPTESKEKLLTENRLDLVGYESISFPTFVTYESINLCINYEKEISNVVSMLATLKQLTTILKIKIMCI